MRNHKESKGKCSEEKILEAVRLRDAGMGYREIAKSMCVGLGTAHAWVNKYAPNLVNNSMRDNRQNTSDTRQSKRITGVVAPDSVGAENAIQEETLEQKVARLERELKDATLMRDFYNEMINVAEKQFNIPIRKKAGTRR